jgi:hypothetical protein
MSHTFRKFAAAGILLISLQGIAQNINESFNDGDFTANPAWSGDASSWIINSNKQLQSNGPAVSGTVIKLSTPSTLASNVQWEFFVNPSVATSSNNYMEVHLMSDVSTLDGNGYFVRIGDTQDDVSLYVKSGASSLKIIDGNDGTIAKTSNNLTKVKVERTASNQWSLYVDAGGSGNSFVIQGSVNNATYTTSAYCGVLAKYSSSNNTKYYFDDLTVQPIPADVTPPSIINSKVISSTQIDIKFSETVDVATSQNTLNYNADNALGNPSSAVRDAVTPNLVHLTFASAFSNGTYYALTVTNVKDLAGNAIPASPPAVTFFSYFLPQPATFKDILINEIMAAPSSSSGLPNAEYVELYNSSGKAIDISQWKFGTNSSSSTLSGSSLIVPPGYYIILCGSSNASLFQPFQNQSNIIIGFSLPALSNSGSRLLLRDQSGNVIDSVAYSDTWYNDPSKQSGGWSLELINPLFSPTCPPDGNWTASGNFSGGTPGEKNSVYSAVPDTDGPMALSATALSSTLVKVVFNEAIDQSLVAQVSNYSIDQGIGTPASAVADPSQRIVTLTLATPMANATNYAVIFSNNLTDCAGNAVKTQQVTLSYYQPKPFDVVINELMPDPDPSIGLPSGVEYVELYNKTPYNISLNGWYISTYSSSGSENRKPLPDVTIVADSFVVLTSSSGAAAFASLSPKVEAVAVSSMPSLTNSGSKIALRNASSQIMSVVTFSDSWYRDASRADGGWSLEQIDPSNPCAGAANWRASVDALGGTPGRQNSVKASNSDSQGPDLVKISVVNSSRLKLFYSEPLDSAGAANVSNYSIDNGITVASANAIDPDYTAVFLNLSGNLQQGTVYTLTAASGIKDCAGNAITVYNTGRFAIPDAVDSFDVVINEVLYNPRTGGADFVELFNRSQKIVDLKDVFVSSIDTLTGTLSSVYQIDSVGFLMFPGDYVVLTTDPEAVKSQYKTLNPQAFAPMASMPSFNISDGRVVISRSDRKIIDRFHYKDTWQYPLIIDKKGVSLERINPNTPSQDSRNWHSASESSGYATPTYRNSQYSIAENDGTELKMEPEVFSPDNDGFDDVVSMNYTFSKPGFTVNLNIYDVRGRLIRSLVRNELTGAAGTFVWDGISDTNSKARIGMYVVILEAFHSDGTTRNIKKTVVVGGKLDE